MDYVMITHGDSDHYSGVEEMIERQIKGVKIERFMLPAVWRENEVLSHLAAKALKKHIPVGEFHPGEGLQMADADFCVCSREWNRVSGRQMKHRSLCI